jgi:hypothetical protein
LIPAAREECRQAENRQREEKVVLVLFPSQVSPLHRHLQMGVVARDKRHVSGVPLRTSVFFFKGIFVFSQSGDHIQRTTMSKEKVAIIPRKN